MNLVGCLRKLEFQYTWGQERCELECYVHMGLYTWGQERCEFEASG